MRNKDAATIASRARRKKTKPGLSALAELRTPAVATQKYMSAEQSPKGDCWLEHLADCGDEFITSDHSGEDIDGGVDFEISCEN